VSGARFARNSLAVMAQRVTQAGSAFVLSAIIARTLGADELGVYMLAFTFYFVAATVASHGMRVHATRQLAREPAGAGDQLVSGAVLQLAAALAALAVIAGIIVAMPYDAHATRICLLHGLMVVPTSLANVADAVLQSRERMHVAAAITVPIHLLRLAAIAWALMHGADLATACAILIASECVVFAGQWLAAAGLARPRWRIDTGLMRASLRSARDFVAIEGLAVFNARIRLVLLSLVGSAATIGMYGCVLQILQPFHIVIHSVVQAVFPALSRTATLGVDQQRALVTKVMRLLLMLMAPAVALMGFAGGDLLLLAYGDGRFAAAGPALAITGAALITSASNRVLAYLLVATGHERVNLHEVMVATLVGVPLSFLLIQQFGLIGAAAAVPAQGVLGFLQFHHAVRRHVLRLDWPRIVAPGCAVAASTALAIAIARECVGVAPLEAIAAGCGAGGMAALIAWRLVRETSARSATAPRPAAGAAVAAG